MGTIKTRDLTKQVLVVQHLISFAHAMRIIKKLKVKKHAALGFYYELIDLGMPVHCKRIRDVVPEFLEEDGYMRTFGDYNGDVQAFHLKVYRDIA